MKILARLGLVAVLTTILAAGAGAQQMRGTEIRVLAGVSAGRLATSSGTTDPLYGLSLGAQVLYPMGERFSFVPELLLVEKGGAQEASGVRIDVDLRSLDLSALARWSAGGASMGRRAFAFAGPTVGYVLSCDAGTGVGGTILPGDCVDNVQRTDLGLTAGVGLELPTSVIDWGVSLRYQHGFSDLSKDSSGLRTRTIQLLLSYRL